VEPTISTARCLSSTATTATAARRREEVTKPSFLNRNEFGGTAGGPVWLPKLYDGRNRTFWFFSHEAHPQHRALL
jgi:hypothetical protein